MLTTNFYEFLEEWDVELATNYSISVLIRTTVQIQEIFYWIFSHCGIGTTVSMLWNRLPWRLRVFLVRTCFDVRSALRMSNISPAVMTSSIMERQDALTLVVTSVIMTFWLDGCHTGKFTYFKLVFHSNCTAVCLSATTNKYTLSQIRRENSLAENDCWRKS